MNNLELFASLRNLAEARRDSEIKDARSRYESAIQSIAALEMSLPPPRKTARPATIRTLPVIDLIANHLPDDRTWTIDDIYGIVREADPSRKVSKETVRTNIHRLIKQGVAKRISLVGNDKRATYAIADFAQSREQTLRERVERIANEHQPIPVSPEHIVVELLDSGFEAEHGNKQLIVSFERIIGELVKSACVCFVYCRRKKTYCSRLTLFVSSLCLWSRHEKTR